MPATTSLELRPNGCAVITLQNPPVNALHPAGEAPRVSRQTAASDVGTGSWACRRECECRQEQAFTNARLGRAPWPRAPCKASPLPRRQSCRHARRRVSRRNPPLPSPAVRMVGGLVVGPQAGWPLCRVVCYKVHGKCFDFLTRAVLSSLFNHARQAQSDPNVKAVVVTGAQGKWQTHRGATGGEVCTCNNATGTGWLNIATKFTEPAFRRFL